MRGAHGRPVRDREAEREQEFLKRQHSMKASSAPAQAVNKEVTISAGTTVKELAEKLGIKANLVIKALVDPSGTPALASMGHVGRRDRGARAPRLARGLRDNPRNA
jgi:hypothetical protein